MKQEQVTMFEYRYPVLAVELGERLYGLYDKQQMEREGIAISVDKYRLHQGFLGLRKQEALELYRALGDMLELMGWNE